MAKTKRRDNRPPNWQDHVKVEIQSVLRLRPLHKKEKGDQIVLEPRRMEDGQPVTAVIHPMLPKPTHPESPAMKMLSPEMLHLCKDTEYHLNQILTDECDQEKVYYSLGLPMARESMDFLKFKKDTKGLKRTSNLILCMGVENSGKTHTCFGASHISKRRSPHDGLVPRILDSLFSQSKHHVRNKRNLSFGVRMSLIQVSQEKSESPRHDDDSVVQDLLLPSLAKAASSPMRSPSPMRNIPTVKALIATLERTKATVGASSAVQNEALVRVHQDLDSTDFITDAVVKTCRDITDARQLLEKGLQSGQRLSSRHRKSHVLAVLQPVLVMPDGSIDREGGKVGILDMAGVDQSSQKKRNTALRRHKDSFGSSSSQNDSALNAVLHCVRSLQHNSMLLSGKTPALDIVDSAYDNGMTIDDCTSEISCVSQEKTSKAKGPTFKVVPYRQHNLTMLLQPFFSPRQTNTTKLTLLVAAYPGHRDHAEKKSMLNDLELLFEVACEPEQGAAVTGFEEKKMPLSPIAYSPSSQSGDDKSIDRNVQKPSKMFDQILSSEKPLPSAPALEDDESLYPVPPPFAPTAPTAVATLPAIRTEHPTPNAPMVCDFPGVTLPTPSENSYAAQRDVAPHPQDRDRSFQVEKRRDSPANRNSYGEPLKQTTAHNIYKPEKWLSSTKHAFNSTMKTGMKMMDKMMTTTPERTEGHHYQHSPAYPTISMREELHKPSPLSHRASPAAKGEERQISSGMTGTVAYRKEVKTHSAMKNKSRKRGGDGHNDASAKRVKRLEKDNRDLERRNRELQQRCARLSAENRELKQTLEGYTKKEWNKEDEEEWQKRRREFAAPPLIQSPLNQHLKAASTVFNSTGRYNFAVGQPQFSLQFPSHFQRASALDARDRQEEEGEENGEDNFFDAKTNEDDKGDETGEDGNIEEKIKDDSQSMVYQFHKTLEKQRRRRSSLVPAVREREDGYM